MKIKFLFLSFFVFTYALTANSQTIKWGTIQKSETNSKAYEILGYDSKGVYLTKYYDSHQGAMNASFPPLVTLEKYSFPNLNREFSKELYVTEDGTEKGPEMYFDGIFCLKDNIVVMMYGNDVKTLYGMKVNADGSIDNNKVQIGTVINKWKKSLLADSRYTFTATKDKSALTGAYVSSPSKSKITLKALDENIKELWTKDIENPFKETKMSCIINIHSVNGDVVYVLVSLGNDSKDPSGYGLIAYDHKFDAVSVCKIELGGDKFPNLIEFDVDNSGNAVVSGFYGDDKSKETQIGTFNVRVDKSGQVAIKNATPFDKDFMAHIIEDGQIKRGKGIDQLGMKDMVVRDDGSVIMAAEQSNCYNGVGRGLAVLMAPHNLGAQATVMQGEGDYYDVVVAKINADGSTAWVKSVAKKQGCQDVLIAHSVCSYSMLVGAKNVYIVFNDSKKNSEKNSQGVIEGDNSDLSINLIDVTAGHPLNMCETIEMSSGSVKRQAISPENADKLRLYSNMSINYTDNKAIIYKGDNGKNDQLGFITIE